MQHGAIGIFDSGYGGLTVLKEIVAQLPEYDYMYLGDNARAPYGTRSYESVYRYTLECVKWFFEQGCPLVILACNTASAKALRTIQQKDLPLLQASNRVLGVIRPTAEVIGQYTHSKKIGILATSGTVQSGSYVLEIEHFYPEVQVVQQACPMWVPLIENNRHETAGADYFIKECIDDLLQQDPEIDAILLACTHYPLLAKKIEQLLPKGIRLLSQGAIVASSLKDYLKRHPDMDQRLLKEGKQLFFTTDSAEEFNLHAGLFYGKAVQSQHIELLP